MNISRKDRSEQRSAALVPIQGGRDPQLTIKQQLILFNKLQDEWQPKLTPGEWSVLSFIARKTICWGKWMDTISIQQITTATNSSSSTVKRALISLSALGLIHRVKKVRGPKEHYPSPTTLTVEGCPYCRRGRPTVSQPLGPERARQLYTPTTTAAVEGVCGVANALNSNDVSSGSSEDTPGEDALPFFASEKPPASSRRGRYKPEREMQTLFEKWLSETERTVARPLSQLHYRRLSWVGTPEEFAGFLARFTHSSAESIESGAYVVKAFTSHMDGSYTIAAPAGIGRAVVADELPF